MRRWISLIEAYLSPYEQSENAPVYQDMLTRVDPEEVRRWGKNDGWDDDEDFLNLFYYWLRDEHSVEVSNGLVTFYRLYNDDTSYIIGSNPILLYHFTSSARVPSIRKHGLVGNRRSVNRRQTEGVYLTTETSGPAVNGYIYNALRGTQKAYGVRIDVRTTLHDIEPDPDDEDIQSGATQFVTYHVAPSQIVGIERA